MYWVFTESCSFIKRLAVKYIAGHCLKGCTETENCQMLLVYKEKCNITTSFYSKHLILSNYWYLISFVFEQTSSLTTKSHKNINSTKIIIHYLTKKLLRQKGNIMYTYCTLTAVVKKIKNYIVCYIHYAYL